MELRVEPDLDPRTAAALVEEVRREAVLRSGHDDEQDLAVPARDGGAVCGGVVGWTWGGCCEVEALWVDPALRGRGLGSRLLGAAEEEALSRGCRQVVVLTHGMQAPAFYKRHGYRLAGEIADYPCGSTALWFCKGLAGSSGAGDARPLRPRRPSGDGS